MKLIIFVVEGIFWTKNEIAIINNLINFNSTVVLVINKIDNLINKKKLLPHIKFLSKQMNFLDIVPISAKNGVGVNIISDIISRHIPVASYYFPRNYITNCSKRFMASEIIREKVMRFLGDELPYSVEIKIDEFLINKRFGYNINGVIFVKKTGQKKIVIGYKGNKIKKIGIAARISMEHYFSTKINLVLFVKVSK
ncbi:GTPase Era [Arsenophonus symbiont of Ornithomya chloropus]|uniref:GTPase Era n=1 Tax=Arsenophonus symbiont of Ornithomya chloropus TaxID=634121 RepID=UPI0032B2117D